MFPQQNRSLLNDKILAFYQDKNATNDSNGDVSIYFDKDGIINTKDIARMLFPDMENNNDIIEALNSYTYDEFLECYTKLHPIFRHCKNIIQIKIQSSRASAMNSNWLGLNAQYYNEIYFKTFSAYNETKTIEHILVLTSLIENALASIYYSETQGKQPPHLLRDLLNSNEVRNVIGSEWIILLKIIMGSPNSINLRNIAWHGFPKPFEIPEFYKDVLQVITDSLGLKINAMNYKIKERPLVNNLEKYFASIDSEKSVDILNLSLYKEEINSIRIDFAKDFAPFWHQIFSYYEAERYFELTVLTLPQIELLLRLHYGEVNKFDISAKLDEYYITMDTIFESDTMANKQKENICNESNKLLNFSEYPQYEGSFHFMYDLFISPNGCRLRDKVSHGQVHLTALNSPRLAKLILHLFLNLLFPTKCENLRNYESKLHLNCLTKHQLAITYSNLQVFNQNMLECSLELPLETLQYSTLKKILIFQRPKKESEFMLLLYKIASNANQTVLNYNESIKIRCSLLAQRDLHSKRRKTLEKLQMSMPEIIKTLSLLWQTVSKLFWLLQTDYHSILDDNTKFLKTLKYLKHSLTISENMIKYAHYDSNEWIKSLELCRKYRDFYNKLFLYGD